ncbi:MAG: hypothetical protein WC373_15120, partial [Smithella sp.]
HTITLADIPINRVGVAIVKEFPNKPMYVLSIITRLHILAEVSEDKRAKEFIKESKDKKSVWISEKLINNVAEFKINKNGKINKKEFFRKLKSEVLS